MVTGMLLASFAFVLAGLVQLQVQAVDKTLKAGETKLALFNALPTDTPIPFRIESMDALKNISFSILFEEVREVDRVSAYNYMSFNLVMSCCISYI